MSNPLIDRLPPSNSLLLKPACSLACYFDQNHAKVQSNPEGGFPAGRPQIRVFGPWILAPKATQAFRPPLLLLEPGETFRRSSGLVFTAGTDGGLLLLSWSYLKWRLMSVLGRKGTRGSGLDADLPC